MPGSTLPERIYGLTVADGRRNVRPGEEIRLRFRAVSVRAAAPAVRASVAIPPGWTALDPVEAELAPCAGGEHGIDLRARAETADDGDAGAFQVALALPEGILGSNVVRIAVRGRPRFEPPASSVRCETGPEPGTIRAVVAFVNSGDAVARDVRVTVPAPPGFSALDVADAIGDVAPGAGCEHHVVFRATAAGGTAVTIAGVRIAFTGGEAALPASAPLALAPCVLPPEVDVERCATRLAVRVRIENAGIVPAGDVPVHIAFPSGWRAPIGSTTVGGAPAAAVVRDGELAVRVPFIGAGSAVVLCAVAVTRSPRAADAVTVSCAGHERIVPVQAPARRSLLLDVRAADALVAPDANVAVRATAWNDGETDESVTLHTGAGVVGRLQLRAGACATAAFTLPAPSGDGDATIAVQATAADGEALAACALVLRRSPLPAAVADESAPLPERPAGVDVAWEAPARAEPGVPFGVQLCARFDAPAAEVAIGPRFTAARYVAGSTRVNGHAVVDGAAPPLLHAGGLRCYDVPAGGTIAVTWSLLPDGSGDVTLAATIAADGSETAATEAAVAVAEAPAFICRPDGLPFHLAAAVIAPAPPVRAPAAPAGVVFGRHLDAARRVALARMLRALRGSGIAAHLPLVAALFPDTVGGDDPLLADALAFAGASIRATYERLFVKLRIPGYDVGPYDLEDAPLRGALVALFDAAAGAAPVSVETPALFVVCTRSALHDARERLARAPLGGIDAVTAAAQLLPRNGADPAAAALGAYAALLADELEAARTLEHDAFAAFLTMHADAALDRACAAAVAALA